MRKFTIQTGPGKLREITVATGRELRRLRRLAVRLSDLERRLAEAAGVSEVAHGFVAGRGPVTMATAHVGYDVTLSVDIANWFPSISEWQLIESGVPPAWARQCCPDGHVPQGLPTSPAAANCAARPMDLSLLAMCDLWMPGVCVYTRYADDLTLSWLAHGSAPEIGARKIVALAVESRRWRLAAHKTRIQYATAGRRIICGLSVGPDDVRPTRYVRRRVRAAAHSAPGSPEWRGIYEWSQCRLPGSGQARQRGVRTLSREE